MERQIITQIYNIDSEQFFNRINAVIDEKLNQISKQLCFEPKQETIYLTRKEAAKLLSVSLVTLNSWAKKGVIQPKKIGNLVRYDKSQLEKAIQ